MKMLHGDCLVQLRTMPDDSVDSLVTDPPAGISFMGKDWDGDKGGREAWVSWMTEVMRECLRVLKPGAHGLVWSLPRTAHWTATALEDAGFEVRDCVTHLFGTGFPKSLDVSKAIDKAAGKTREVVGRYQSPEGTTGDSDGGMFGKAGLYDITAPATDAARQWQGFGTALKPACEFWWLVRQPLAEKTVAANVLKHGTGGIAIDRCRITTADQQHGADACTQLSSLYFDACNQRVAHARALDSLQRVCAALRSCSTADTDPSRDEGDRDGTLPARAEYARLAARLFPNGVWCGQQPRLAQGSLSGCHAYRRFCDEHAPTLLAAAQGGAPSLLDALNDIVPSLSDRTHSRSSQHNARPSSADDSDLLLQSLLSWLLFPISTACSAPPQGRFPSNLVLSHSDGCELVGTKKVKATAPPGAPSRGKPEADGSSWSKGKTTPNLIQHNDGDGTETVEAWECVEGCAVRMLDDQSGPCKSGGPSTGRGFQNEYVGGAVTREVAEPYSKDRGTGASRFFYVAKASKSDRGEGNKHPTVKSTKLMGYLCRLVTPPGGTVLDPFMGSGSTGVAAKAEGFNFVGIEQTEEYFEIARSRLG